MPALWTKAFPGQHKKLVNPNQVHRTERLATAKHKRRREAKPCNKVSKEQARENRIYRIENPKFLAAHPWCERCLTKGLKVPATEVHHWAGRDRNFLKKEWWKASCHICNMFAKNEPAAARAEQWLAPIGVYATG